MAAPHQSRYGRCNLLSQSNPSSLLFDLGFHWLGRNGFILLGAGILSCQITFVMFYLFNEVHFNLNLENIM